MLRIALSGGKNVVYIQNVMCNKNAEMVRGKAAPSVVPLIKID
jgi:hypothetical protein